MGWYLCDRVQVLESSCSLELVINLSEPQFPFLQNEKRILISEDGPVDRNDALKTMKHYTQ